jgi:hypothetical protein
MVYALYHGEEFLNVGWNKYCTRYCSWELAREPKTIGGRQ